MKNIYDLLSDFSKNILVAIDGNAASGKGTIATRLAEEFNLYYCQTSIFYRKLAKIVISDNVNDAQKIIKLASDYEQLARTDEQDIYNQEITNKASLLGAIKEVRLALNIPQRRLIQEFPRIVMEGRDIGTVIAPNADLKLYMTADLDMRAERRLAQFNGQNKCFTLQEVKRDLSERDARDMRRENAPLVIAKDALFIDSTDLTINEVYDQIMSQVSNMHRQSSLV